HAARAGEPNQDRRCHPALRPGGGAGRGHGLVARRGRGRPRRAARVAGGRRDLIGVSRPGGATESTRTRSLTGTARCALKDGVDLRFSPIEEAFRAELREWLGANVPPEWQAGEPPEFASLGDEVAFLRDWQRRLAAGHWVGIHWPREYGGRG